VVYGWAREVWKLDVLTEVMDMAFASRVASSEPCFRPFSHHALGSQAVELGDLMELSGQVWLKF